MPRLTIDNRNVEVPPGGTVLDAARVLGIDIPTLCHLDGYEPSTSCMLCLVKVKLKGRNRLVPSCATPAEEGMEVESETPQVRQVRKTGLELLLSDHLGDCLAPCQNACPLHMDIPRMLRQVAEGDLRGAIMTVRNDIALPAVLGRVCGDLCERACRRKEVDSPAAICLIKRFVADTDLASNAPYLPTCLPPSGKNVAVVGAGPTGLSAAYHLRLAGHGCTLFDKYDQPGGMLHREIDEQRLPRAILDAEIALIVRMGAQLRMKTPIRMEADLTKVRKRFDAVLLAFGPQVVADLDRLGLREKKGSGTFSRNGPEGASQKRCLTPFFHNPNTHETNLPGVFAAGDVVRQTRSPVRAVADGKTAAMCIDQYLAGVPVTGVHRAFMVHAGRLHEEEIARLLEPASHAGRTIPSGGPTAGFTADEARAEALRCLQCDCGAQCDCKLRHYAQMYDARTSHYRGERRTMVRHLQHGEIIYEPGKCILCGLCVQIATEAGESLGLTFIGRGFDVRVDVPFDRSLAEGLQRVGEQCARTCPSGALLLRSERSCGMASCAMRSCAFAYPAASGGC